MTNPLLPLVNSNHELPKSNTANNHEQQIYGLRSRVIGNRQANEKMLVLFLNSWP
jgi:hypothetical protein